MFKEMHSFDLFLMNIFLTFTTLLFDQTLTVSYTNHVSNHLDKMYYVLENDVHYIALWRGYVEKLPTAEGKGCYNLGLLRVKQTQIKF